MVARAENVWFQGECIDWLHNQCKTCSPSIYRLLQDNIDSRGLFERRHSQPNWLWRVRGGSWSMALSSWDEQRQEEEEGKGERWARISQDDKHSWLLHHLHLQDKLGTHFSEHMQVSFTGCSRCVPEERVWIYDRSTASPHFILFSLVRHKETHLRNIWSTCTSGPNFTWGQKSWGAKLAINTSSITGDLFWADCGVRTRLLQAALTCISSIRSSMFSRVGSSSCLSGSIPQATMAV